MPERPSIPDDQPVLGGMFTVSQLQADYRNAFAVPKCMIDELEDRLRTAEELRRKAAIGEVQEETHERINALLLGIPSLVHAIRRRVSEILHYREHLTEIFRQYDCEDAELIGAVHKKHPARKQLGQVTRALRRVARGFPKEPEREIDFRRLSLLLIKALQLASARRKPDHHDRVNVNVLTQDKLWNRRLAQQAELERKIAAERGSGV